MISTDLIRYLSGATSLGSSSSCAVRVPLPGVSRYHALVAWTRGGWVLRDLGSRNGCFINGHRVDHRRDLPLRRGDRVGLGTASPTFELLADEGPRPFLRHEVTGEERAEGEDGAICFAGGQLRRDLEHGWLLERADGLLAPWSGFMDGWRLLVPEAQLSTSPLDRDLLTMTMLFEVCGAAVAPRLVLRSANEELDLGRCEPFGPLLELARARAVGTGWISKDRLSQRAFVKPRTLDVYLGRARDCLIDEGVENADRLVEVVPSMRRLGLPPERVLIREEA